MTSNPTSSDYYENHLLPTTISKLYLDTEIADVHFVFREKNKRKRSQKRVPAHKSFLAVGSDVFKAMFYGELKEEGDVTIVDASKAAFEEFLQFFYLSKVKLTMENIPDVVNLGRKYNVKACLDTCERFLEDKLTNDNVCFVYGLAILFDLDKLKNQCVGMITANTKDVFGSTSFLECERNVFSNILKFDALNCQEIDVFHACIDWVKAKTKQREVSKETVRTNLGDLFYEIRFGSMSFEEFADLTPMYGQLFSLEEYQDIVQMIRSKNFQSKLFKTSPRQVQLKWNEDAIIECGGGNIIASRELPLESIEKITFKSNERVLLGEIGCATLEFSTDVIPTSILVDYNRS